MRRRTFLQQLGWTLAALGTREWAGMSDRYHQALAQSLPRKLALLVGINQYPHNLALSGCVTDVELQRELLQYRFGFQPADILTLTDQQATRENIETAFVEHLMRQVKPDDLVVFHFSGYGGQVNRGATAEELQTSLVPFDGIPNTTDSSVVNDLLEETLLLLLRSLPTDRIVTVLDTSYIPDRSTNSRLQGSLRVRARPQLAVGEPATAELAFQEQLLEQLRSSRDQVAVQRRSGQLPGIIVAAAKGDPIQLATSNLSTVTVPGNKAFEAQWSGFSAGLFTYTLTQALWAATPATTLQFSLSRATLMLEQLAGQEEHPLVSGQKVRGQDALSDYFSALPEVAAEGVITATESEGKIGQLWLAGLPATVIEHYGLNSIFNVVTPEAAAIAPDHDPTAIAAATEMVPLSTEPLEDTDGDTPAAATIPTPPLQLQLYARNGLVAKVRVSSPPNEAIIQPGQLLQEAIRILPRRVNLMVALDPELARIERVDATSALAGLTEVTAVTAGEQYADCVFSRVGTARSTPPITAAAVADVALRPATGDATVPVVKYGLFSLGRELIPNTSAEGGEAVKSAVYRLLPYIKTLLARKLIRLTANERSSRLGVQATLEMIKPQAQMLSQRTTIRAPGSPILPVEPEQTNSAKSLSNRAAEEVGLPSLPIGSRIQYRVQNYSDRPVYLMLLGIDSNGSPLLFYGGQSTASSAAGETAKPTLKQVAIGPGETLTVPQASSSFEWAVREPTGLAETQLILSCAPFTQTYALLESSPHPSGNTQRISVPTNPLEIAQAILQDLHQASAVPSNGSSTDTYALDVNAWATLSFVYHVV